MVAKSRLYIACSGLEEGITTRVADMWRGPFPAADLHLYSYILHNWPPAKCDFLVRKSFSSLPPGGVIAIYQVFLDDQGTGPFAAAAFSMEIDLLAATGLTRISSRDSWYGVLPDDLDGCPHQA